MTRALWFILVLLAAAAVGRAQLDVMLTDTADDGALVNAVSGHPAVKESAAKVEAIDSAVVKLDLPQIEKRFGKPVTQPTDLAMPLGQNRSLTLSGTRAIDESQNKDHLEYYAIGDFAGVQVWYGTDGTSPQAAVLFLKIDKHFPKLIRTEKPGEAGAPKVGRPTRAHTIDMDHWMKAREIGTSKAALAELFSAPAGDYAPGTEYLTPTCGWQRGPGGAAVETLEWRSENGRAVAEFDAKGNLVTTTFHLPGRDPQTNVADRLKWDRARLERVSEFIKERAELSGTRN